MMLQKRQQQAIAERDSRKANNGINSKDDLLYHQIAQLLRRQIETGEFPAGKALPSERRLAETLSVSRVSVRKAIEELVEQGLLIKKRGSGTYVIERLSQSLSALHSFTEEIAARGLAADYECLDTYVGTPTPDEVMSLGIRTSDTITRITRLRRTDGEPLTIQTSAVLQAAMPDPAELGASLYALMDNYGHRPVRAQQRLSAVAIVGHEAELLQVVPGSPGLQTTRIGYREDGLAVEYTRSLFRGDRWDCITELTIA